MKWLRRLLDFLSFAGFYALEIVLCNLRVAHDVLTPGNRARPGIIAVPVRLRGDLELLLLSNLISMTPGTMTLDVSSDRSTLYIHAMFVDDPEAVRRAVIEQLERRILRLIRQ